MASNPSTDKIFPVPLNSLKSIRFIYIAAGLRHSAAVTGSTSQTISISVSIQKSFFVFDRKVTFL
jgi:hypothetical protein